MLAQAGMSSGRLTSFQHHDPKRLFICTLVAFSSPDVDSSDVTWGSSSDFVRRRLEPLKASCNFSYPTTSVIRCLKSAQISVVQASCSESRDKFIFMLCFSFIFTLLWNSYLNEAIWDAQRGRCLFWWIWEQFIDICSVTRDPSWTQCGQRAPNITLHGAFACSQEVWIHWFQGAVIPNQHIWNQQWWKFPSCCLSREEEVKHLHPAARGIHICELWPAKLQPQPRA